MKKMQEEVVKPLVQEVRVNEEITERLKKDNKKMHDEFRMFNAIIRLPRMCDQF